MRTPQQTPHGSATVLKASTTVQYFLKYLTDVLEWSRTVVVRKFQQNKVQVYCMTD